MEYILSPIWQEDSETIGGAITIRKPPPFPVCPPFTCPDYSRPPWLTEEEDNSEVI